MCSPSHLFHVLQRLDVSIFGTFKSHLERNLHAACRHVAVLDAFVIAYILRSSYEKIHTSSNVRSGLYRSDVCDENICRAFVDPFHCLSFYSEHCLCDAVCTVPYIPTLDDVSRRFKGRVRD